MKSLDNTTAANFFALRQRLATIQGLIYTKIQSLTASKNQCDLARAQAELNPQLTAWKQEFPFRFAQQELVGRWPWHAILFMILFACEYFDALLQLNREMNSDRVKFLAHDCPAANSLRSQIFSRSPLVLIAAREALDLALLVTNGNFANLWYIDAPASTRPIANNVFFQGVLRLSSRGHHHSPSRHARES